MGSGSVIRLGKVPLNFCLLDGQTVFQRCVTKSQHSGSFFLFVKINYLSQWKLRDLGSELRNVKWVYQYEVYSLTFNLLLSVM